MRAEGKDWKEIAKIFGLESQAEVLHRIAVGLLPGIQNTVLAHNVSLDDAIRYLLPLRIETGRNPENGNERLYDYSEVTECIEKLTSIPPKLNKENLPAYSTERRLIIQRTQRDARQEEIAAKLQELWPEGKGLNQAQVSRLLCKSEYDDFCIKIQSDLRAGHPVEKISKRYELPPLLVWALALTGKDDAERLAALRLTLA